MALPILTPSESGELDRRSAERGVSVDALMENAGRAVAWAARRMVGGVYGRRAVVVCGKGNNGGDGLVAAWVLDRWGMAVTVFLLDESGDHRGAAGANLRRYREAGGMLRSFEPSTLERALDRADVAVDAIFGTGFRGRPEGPAAEAIDLVNRAPAAVVAVDIPSGVDGATGAVRGAAVWAEVTVTFGAHKPGVVFFPGAGHAGFVEVAGIGFPSDLVASDLHLLEAADVAGLLPVRDADAHKRASGVVLVLAGSQAMTGAAVLTATAAYRAGAGLVTMAVPEGILRVVEESVAETTFLPLPETPEGTVAEAAWPVLEERLATVDAAAVGPGLTTNAATGELVRRMVAHSPAPIVLDADGLNAFEGRGVELADRKSDAVVTPHLGEFARLVGGTSQEIADQRVAQVRAASSEFRCPVLLKGTRTLVGEPGGRVTVNPTGGRYLATGGTGDVLTGAIGAFLARGLAPADAARLAAYVHGAAGQLAGAHLGEGAMASDVLARLPDAMAALARAGP